MGYEKRIVLLLTEDSILMTSIYNLKGYKQRMIEEIS